MFTGQEGAGGVQIDRGHGRLAGTLERGQPILEGKRGPGRLGGPGPGHGLSSCAADAIGAISTVSSGRAGLTTG